MHLKDKSCNRPEGLQLYKKETPIQVFCCDYSKSFRNNFFYRRTTVAAFELCFSIRKNFKKEVSGEIAFDLISLFHVQIQEFTRTSTTTKACVFPAKFYYHKISETRSRWWPKHLMTLLPRMEKCPIDLYHRVYFNAQIW